MLSQNIQILTSLNYTMQVNDEKMNPGTTQPHLSACPECRNLKFSILKQLEAFKVLTSLNASLSSDIIIQNIQGLIAQHDEDHGMETGAALMIPPVTQQLTPVVHQIVRSDVKINGHPRFEEMDTMDEPVLQPSPATSTPPIVPRKAGRPKTKKVKVEPPNNPQVWREKCLNLISTLMTRPDASPFKNEASPSMTHTDPLSCPMSLDKIEKNLHAGKYTVPREFHKDMMLIFHNARLHDININSPLRIKARSLENFYESSVQSQNILEDSNDDNDKNQQEKLVVTFTASAVTKQKIPPPSPNLKISERKPYRCPKCSMRLVRKCSLWSHQRACGQKGKKVPAQNFEKKESKRKDMRFSKNRPKPSYIAMKNSKLYSKIPANRKTNLRPKKSSKTLKKSFDTSNHAGSPHMDCQDDMDVHLFVKKLYPKFNLIHALTAKVEIERLHPKTILAARKKIKNSVPCHKASKWGRKCSAKKRRMAIMKMDRISGLYNSQNFLTKSKKAAAAASRNHLNKKKKRGAIMTSKPMAVTLTFSSSNNNNNSLRERDDLKVKENENESIDLSFNASTSTSAIAVTSTPSGGHPDNSMLVISSAEAAAFGLNPFDPMDEEGEYGQLPFDDSSEIFNPISEMMVGHVVIGCHGEEENEEEEFDVSDATTFFEMKDRKNEIHLGNQSKTIENCPSSLDNSVETFVLPTSNTEVADDIETVKQLYNLSNSPAEDPNNIPLVEGKEGGGGQEETSADFGHFTFDEGERSVAIMTASANEEEEDVLSIREDERREVTAIIEVQIPVANEVEENESLQKEAMEVDGPEEKKPSMGKKEGDLKKTSPSPKTPRLVQAERRRTRIKCLDCPMDFGDIQDFWKHQAICEAAIAREKAMEFAKAEAARLETLRAEEEKSLMDDSS